MSKFWRLIFVRLHSHFYRVKHVFHWFFIHLLKYFTPKPIFNFHSLHKMKMFATLALGCNSNTILKKKLGPKDEREDLRRKDNASTIKTPLIWRAMDARTSWQILKCRFVIDRQRQCKTARQTHEKQCDTISTKSCQIFAKYREEFLLELFIFWLLK